MIKLSIEEIIRIHEKIIEASGGMPGLRDRGLLESAVYSADAGYGEVELYASTEEKAARLAYAITTNHAFVDGNKRIGIMTALMTLRLNDIKLKYDQSELIALGLSIADGTSDYEQALAFIKTHRT